VLLDLDGDGVAEILLSQQPRGSFIVYKEHEGEWTILGVLENSTCSSVRDELLAGRFELATPEVKEIKVDGGRLQVRPYRPCP
jgi:hypothetical protein